MSDIKLCMNCKHFYENRQDAKDSKVECAHPGNQEQDYVRGGAKHFFINASALRLNDDKCGPAAKWWEQGYPYQPVEPKHVGFFVRVASIFR